MHTGAPNSKCTILSLKCMCELAGESSMGAISQLYPATPRYFTCNNKTQKIWFWIVYRQCLLKVTFALFAIKHYITLVYM